MGRGAGGGGAESGFRAQALCENRGGRAGLISLIVSADVKQDSKTEAKQNQDSEFRSKLQALVYDILPPWRKVPESNARSAGQELCESRGGCPELHVTNQPDGFCGGKATLKRKIRILRKCLPKRV